MLVAAIEAVPEFAQWIESAGLVGLVAFGLFRTLPVLTTRSQESRLAEMTKQYEFRKQEQEQERKFLMDYGKMQMEHFAATMREERTTVIEHTKLLIEIGKEERR